MAYIQQVLVKAAVSPWDNSLVPVDVFRSPLGRVFSLLEEIRNHVYTDRSKLSTLTWFWQLFFPHIVVTIHFTKPLSFLPDFFTSHRSLEALCLQVTDLLPGLRRMQAILPEHGCLLVSPGNYWQNRRDLFDADPDLLKTVHQHEPKGLHTSATLRGGNSLSTFEFWPALKVSTLRTCVLTPVLLCMFQTCSLVSQESRQVWVYTARSEWWHTPSLLH